MTEYKPKYSIWYIRGGPPEMCGDIVLDEVEVWEFWSWNPPDNNETFESKEAAIDAFIKRLEELKEVK